MNKATLVIGGDVLALQADISDLKQIAQLYQKIAEKFGKIDVSWANV